jgi:hypothetical protein
MAIPEISKTPLLSQKKHSFSPVPPLFREIFMATDQLNFFDLCRVVEEGVQTDLSNADRELLIVLHRALTGLKTAVEKALLNAAMDEHVVN